MLCEKPRRLRGRRNNSVCQSPPQEVNVHPRPVVLAAVLAAVAVPALAQAPDPNLGRNLAATCANCHGTNGHAQGAVASLAGQPKADLVQKMNEYRDGKRQATIMHQLAKGYTPEQIELVAAWFAAQKAK
jgi:cytochrome c553